jgi:hypothetical protein
MGASFYHVMDPDLFFDPFRAHQNRIQCFSPTDSDVERSAHLRKDWKNDACSAFPVSHRVPMMRASLPGSNLRRSSNIMATSPKVVR